MFLALTTFLHGLDGAVEAGRAEQPYLEVIFQDVSASEYTIDHASATFKVDLRINYVANMWGWSTAVTWNPDVLTCTKKKLGPFNPAGAFLLGGIDNEAGRIPELAASTLEEATTTGSGVACTLTFIAHNSGTSLINLTDTNYIDLDAKTKTFIEEVDGQFECKQFVQPLSHDMVMTNAETFKTVFDDTYHLNDIMYENYSANVNSDRIVADEDSVELIVGLKEIPESYGRVAAVATEYNSTVVNKISTKKRTIAAVVDVPFQEIAPFVSDVKASGVARYVEPNLLYELFVEPNDANWTAQWGPKKIGANWAWNTTTGDPDVVVAVIDSGVDWSHTDLAANIWNNTDEIPDNGEDDDDNGYIDDVRGWNFAQNNSDPMDYDGHGTHCSGIIAAVTNNSIGIAGVSWDCKIMPLRTSLAADEVIAAIYYATDNAADVISMSFGNYGYNTDLHQALQYAYNHSVLLVAGAGNDGTTLKSYPAAHEEVIAVTATNQTDNPASFTNRGNWVELAAPGVGIYSTVPGGYENHSGTSMACPHVAGVAALALSQFPNASCDWMRTWLQYKAEDLGSKGFDIWYGYGRIDASGAIEPQSEHDLFIKDWETPVYLKVGEEALVNTTVFNIGTNNETDITVQLLVNGSVVDSEAISFLPSGNFSTVTCSWTPQVEGTYNVTSYVVPVLGETLTEKNTVWKHLGTGKIIRVRQDFSTIQEAVDAAISGDTILVAPGTYYENIIVTTPGLTLLGEDRDNTIIDGNETGTIVEVSADNTKVSGFKIRKCGDGYKGFNPESAIWLLSENNVIENNIIVDNRGAGITLGSALAGYIGPSTVINNNVSSCDKTGIMVESCNNVIVANNYISSCERCGVWVFWGDNTVVANNVISSNSYGIAIQSSIYKPTYNVVKRNYIKNNTYTFYQVFGVAGSEYRIYENSFIDNYNLLPETSLNNIVWDNGFTGNYWSNYTGVDWYSGSYQNETGSDGIGDSPHVIDADNTDPYPLMTAYQVEENWSFEDRYVSEPGVYGCPSWQSNDNGWREFIGDIDGDGDVDAADNSAFIDAWYSYYSSPTGLKGDDWKADFDGDGDIDEYDLWAFCASYIRYGNLGPRHIHGAYSWYINGSSHHTMWQQLSSEALQQLRGRDVRFSFRFRLETIGPSVRSEIWYDDGTEHQRVGSWVTPTSNETWHEALVDTFIPATATAINLTIRGDSDFNAWIDCAIIHNPPHRYMRGDKHTINSLTAYKLGTDQSDTEKYKARSKTGSANLLVEWGMRVWRRDSGGNETEITSGQPVAVVSRNTNGEGIQYNRWSCPEESLDSTDAIVVRVYMRIGGDYWSLLDTFITEQLGAEKLAGVTWGVYYYTYRTTFPGGGGCPAFTQGRFYWGTESKNSRIVNFGYTDA